WSVFRRQGEALTDRIIREVASAGHLAEPLARIPLIDVCTLCQFSTCRWPLVELFEEAKTVTDIRHHRCNCAGHIGQHFPHERFRLCLIDTLLGCHFVPPGCTTR